MGVLFVVVWTEGVGIWVLKQLGAGV